jgi:hypothetical protein
MTTVYVLRLHQWNEFTQFQFHKLYNELKNVFILFDDTLHDFPIGSHLSTIRISSSLIPEDSQVILFNFDECLQINPLHRSNKEQIEAQLIIFNRLCSIPFEYVWLIEYDVFCDGNWNKTLNICESNQTDFLATEVFEYTQQILWNHWFSIYGRRRNKPILSERVKCFFPITRFSKSLILIMEKNIGIYSGFCEVFVPTLAKQNNLSIQNLPFTMFHPTLFVYRHNEKPSIQLLYKNQLLHPITSFELFIHKINTLKEFPDEDTYDDK